MVTAFTDWDRDPNYLAHFGVKGMKHGQRRYQNPDGSLTALGRERYGVKGTRGAHGTAKDLNKLDREKTTSMYRRDKYASKIAKKDARYADKIAKAEAAGKSGKAAKLKGKQADLSNSRAAKKVKGYQDLINKNSSVTQKIINSAKSKGYGVASKYTERIVNKGALAAKAAIGAGALGGAAYGLGKFITNRNVASGNITKPFKVGNKYWAMEGSRGGIERYQLGVRRGKQVMSGATILTGAGVGATAKVRKGTKYKVSNKYRSR